MALVVIGGSVAELLCFCFQTIYTTHSHLLLQQRMSLITLEGAQAPAVL